MLNYKSRAYFASVFNFSRHDGKPETTKLHCVISIFKFSLDVHTIMDIFIISEKCWNIRKLCKKPRCFAEYLLSTYPYLNLLIVNVCFLAHLIQSLSASHSHPLPLYHSSSTQLSVHALSLPLPSVLWPSYSTIGVMVSQSLEFLKAESFFTRFEPFSLKSLNKEEF